LFFLCFGVTCFLCVCVVLFFVSLWCILFCNLIVPLPNYFSDQCNL
jgi:hypothetical protein